MRIDKQLSKAETRPRALILSTATGYGGAERSLEALLPAMAKHYHLHVLVENNRHLARCREALNGTRVEISCLPHMSRFIQVLYGVVWLLRRAIRNPVFILANTNKSGFIVGAAVRLCPALGGRTVLYIRDFQWCRLNFITKALPDALYLFPSQALLDSPDYIASYLRPAGKLRWEVVPNIVMPTQSQAIELPEELKSILYVLILASIGPWKGQLHLLNALTNLPENIHAVLCGGITNPPYYAKLKEQVQRLNLENRVHFLPYWPNPEVLIRSAVCVAITSVAAQGGPETFGRIVIEAWQEQTPVIAFNIGGPKYIVTHEKDGLLVPEGDEVALGNAILRLMKDAELAETLTKNGFVRAQSDFNADVVYDLFAKALANTSNAAPC